MQKSKICETYIDMVFDSVDEDEDYHMLKTSEPWFWLTGRAKVNCGADSCAGDMKVVSGRAEDNSEQTICLHAVASVAADDELSEEIIRIERKRFALRVMKRNRVPKDTGKLAKLDKSNCLKRIRHGPRFDG